MSWSVSTGWISPATRSSGAISARPASACAPSSSTPGNRAAASAQRAAVALCDDLQRRHPERRLLLLLVHCRNSRGVAVYRKAGFVDTGELFGGGRAGPQHLMLRPLPAVAESTVGQSSDG